MMEAAREVTIAPQLEGQTLAEVRGSFCVFISVITLSRELTIQRPPYRL